MIFSTVYLSTNPPPFWRGAVMLFSSRKNRGQCKTWDKMAEMSRIKSSPQNWRAWGLIISELTGQEILKFEWWVVIDVEYRISKIVLIFFNNLVKLFTVQNRLELCPQLPTVWMKSLTMFSGALHLLHHYKSNLAHLLAF